MKLYWSFNLVLDLIFNYLEANLPQNFCFLAKNTRILRQWQVFQRNVILNGKILNKIVQFGIPLKETVLFTKLQSGFSLCCGLTNCASAFAALQTRQRIFISNYNILLKNGAIWHFSEKYDCFLISQPVPCLFMLSGAETQLNLSSIGVHVKRTTVNVAKGLCFKNLNKTRQAKVSVKLHPSLRKTTPKCQNDYSGINSIYHS